MASADVATGIVRLDKLNIVEETTAADLKKVEAILEKFSNDSGAVVAILHEIKEELGNLPEEAIEFVGNKIGIPVSRLCSSIEAEEEGVCTEEGIAFYPRCRECEALLTKTPFTDLNTVFVTTLFCPKCGKENTFYIDLERMFRPKNKWCTTCQKFTRNYNHNHECPRCGDEVFRTKSRTDTTPIVEYYPRCPDCRKVLTQKPFTDINTVTVAEFYCADCDKNHWLYIDVGQIYK